MAKLRPRLLKGIAMYVSRIAIKADRIVYFIITRKSNRYRWGKSRITYIGTSKRGMTRIATSAANKADELLNWHGVRYFEMLVATCEGKQSVTTWKIFESALLLRFRERHGEVPWLNAKGKKMKETDQFRYFSRKALDAILDKVEATKE